MIHDAKVEVTCDGEGCFESTLIEPDYVCDSYSSYGYYDTRKESINIILQLSTNWTVDKHGNHLCEWCSDEENE